MFRCPSCGSISQNAGACGVCGAATHETQVDSSSTKPARQLRGFWTATKFIALTVVVLIALSSVGAGLYLYARPSGPSCTNDALNYPSCNACGSSTAFNSSTNTCVCTNVITVNNSGGVPVVRGAVNPPACNRFCANNAINPPGCDQCPDNHTDVVCPPGVPQEMTESITVPSLDMLHTRTGGDISTGSS
jgi:hypothetical protein